jgi:integrase
MSLATNVVRRGATYYFRARVPERFRVLLGRQELWRSLRTSDRSTARRLASAQGHLTELLWRDLQRLMSSSASRPDPQRVKALIDQWLRAELDEDAYVRSMPLSALHAGVIMERRPDGQQDVVVRYLDDEEARDFVDMKPKEQAAALGRHQFYRSQVTDQELRQHAQDKVFGNALLRHQQEDASVASRYVEEVFRRAGIEVDPFSELFENATNQMLRAQKDFGQAIDARTQAAWRPQLDLDPAAPLLAGLSAPPAEPPLSKRAKLRLSEAAREAISEIERREEFKPKRRKDYETAAATLELWFGSDPILADVTPEKAGEFNAALGRYPTNVKKRREYRDLKTFAERRALAVSTNDPDVLSPTTINGKYLTPLRQIFDWHQKAGSGLPNPFEGVSTRKPKRKDPQEQRRDFSKGELQRLFDLPLFTGSQGDRWQPLYKPGPVRVSDHRFWVPLICTFSGLRLNEACGLGVADIKFDSGIAYFHVRDEREGQSVKAWASRRKVPLHHVLIELGLLDYVERIRATGAAQLFPELKLSSSGYYSEAPSKFFINLLKRIEDDDADEPGKLVFHSTRHSATSRLRAAEVRSDVSHEIIGHAAKDTHATYGNFDIPTLKAAVDKIVYPGLDLSRLKFPDPGS